jgi:hypothetical protein
VCDVWRYWRNRGIRLKVQGKRVLGMGSGGRGGTTNRQTDRQTDEKRAERKKKEKKKKKKKKEAMENKVRCFDSCGFLI